MLLSVLINKLAELYDKQGDCEVVIDNDLFSFWCEDFDIVDKYYQQNSREIDGKYSNRVFILIDEDIKFIDD